MAGILIPPALALGGEPVVEFARDVRPILSDYCYKCHGPDSQARKSDLRLDQREALIKEVDGHRAVVPEHSEQSELFRRITSSDDDERMPPRETGRRLTAEQIELVRRWIEQGANWGAHWSFVAPRRPELPSVEHRDWPRNPIDFFVLARLERAGLEPSRTAGKPLLLRRVTLDLTGLPPTPLEVQAFLADEAPDAYERVVDRLLASPRYGERMALEWLDAARFADTDGYQGDSHRKMWPWRDWVIRVLNANLPFDQFTIEQLAGDLLPGSTLEQKIATGFNRNHRHNDEDGIIPEEFLVEYVADRTETMATVWMGLTVGCARCHDHKYDPITQREYYQLFAFFNSVDEKGRARANAAPVVAVPTEQQAAQLAKMDAAITECRSRLAAADTEENKAELARLEKEKQAFDAGILKAMVLEELPEQRPTWVLERGAYDKHGAAVVAGVPAALPRLAAYGPVDRLDMARWLTDPAHPLTARVAVNRYWQLFFGQGIVRTPEDFGSQGMPPTHPELLDWLATEFSGTGWNVKAMHRLIVTSATYRQTSRWTPQLLEKDPDNLLLARVSRVRLSAHAIRDQALAASGLLVEQVGGPSVMTYQPVGLWDDVVSRGKEFEFVQVHGEGLYRRSLYSFWKRTVTPPAMQVFDAASRETCTVRQTRTNTPLQALVLLNDVTYVEAARHLAQRVMHEAPSGLDDRLRYGLLLVLGRAATTDEINLLSTAWQDYRTFYASSPESALKLLSVGESPRDDALDPNELAAYAAVMSTILNLDETITRE